MRTLSCRVVAAIVFLTDFLFSSVVLADDAKSVKPTPRSDIELLAHGRYLSKIARCNDCHTSGYALSRGDVPESQWLTGGTPEGTALPGTVSGPNIRLRMERMTEDQWVEMARTRKGNSPMPWYNLGSMTGDDLRSIYRFVRSLGSTTEPEPDGVPSDSAPKQ